MSVQPARARIKSGSLTERSRARAGGWFAWTIVALTAIGGLMRVACCFWGYPYQMHPDESAIVLYVYKMFERHSWLACTYNRPDQFEIKCLAVIYMIFSRLRYHLPVLETFEQHQAVYYTIARLYMTAFGTAMIPLTSLLTGTVLRGSVKERGYRRYAQILAAGLMAFSPVFVENSAYATPDVPLACMVLLTAYFAVRYAKSGEMKMLCATACTTGVSVTIKYPGAILCFLIAFAVIYRAVKTKKYREILTRGFFSFAVVVMTMFFIAPDLFRYYPQVIDAIKSEARPTHLGADGLGFWGNLLFYYKTAVRNVGALSAVFMAAGVVFLLAHRRIEHSFALGGLFFWVCMSVLSLHWLRWGLPMYTFYIMLTAIGGTWMIRAARQRTALPACARCAATGAVLACSALLIVNSAVSGAAVVRQQLTKDTRIAALEYCNAHGITPENSVYEGLTPFKLANVQLIGRFLSVDENGLQYAEGTQDKEYLLFSDNFRSAYLNEPERYANQVKLYGLIEETLPLVHAWQATLHSDNPWEIPNILSNLRYIAQEGILSGSDMWIYRLHPEAQP